MQSDFEVDVLRSMVVADVMSTETLSPNASVAEARRRLESGAHGAYPVVDAEGRCVGIVARHDLLAANVDDRQPVAAVAARDVVTAAPGETVLGALRMMLDEAFRLWESKEK